MYCCWQWLWTNCHPTNDNQSFVFAPNKNRQGKVNYCSNHCRCCRYCFVDCDCCYGCVLLLLFLRHWVDVEVVGHEVIQSLALEYRERRNCICIECKRVPPVRLPPRDRLVPTMSRSLQHWKHIVDIFLGVAEH